MESAEVLVDVRDLPAPEPLQRILAAVKNHRPGSFIRMVHRMEPCHLYPALEKGGFGWRLTVTENADPDFPENFEIVIWKHGDEPIERLLGV